MCIESISRRLRVGVAGGDHAARTCTRRNACVERATAALSFVFVLHDVARARLAAVVCVGKRVS